ncbi:hypothetical protein THAOC_11568 [Thalassiosira oceanica]|uniref:Uncharacterized protein n=1 Tax=Thalassiosira oceanica TaxID=159749 RepID=K0T283_THAOC|nr:hypothetical protein THAOC_11568 [Thalassiosira oceanica]|eukprot:EJK67406.1 hypothetical protein THAOC_11568 [Thalassiosira oceanica]
MPTSRPKLVGHQDDIKGIHLRRREADGPNPRITAVQADVFGSFVRRRATEIRCQIPLFQAKIVDAPCEDRTHDFRIMRPALYLLS